MNGNGCRRCGHCCIVYMNITLTKEEVAEGLYVNKRGASSFRGHRETLDLSKYVVMRARVLVSELGREVFACVYWDPESRECLIFEDRPQVCRGFDCNDNHKGAYGRAVWDILEEAEIDMECLRA